MMDLAYQPGRVLAKAQDVHIVSSGLGVLLLGIVALGVLIGPAMNGVGMAGMSILSLAIFILYIVGSRMIIMLEKERANEVLQLEASANAYEPFRPADLISCSFSAL